MFERAMCLLIGYACGMFLTAEVVMRARTGKSARDVGSRNPGMANVASQLGAPWALVTLAGDIAKTAVACELCRWVLFGDLGQLAVLYAGFGAVLGHNFPAWMRFRGGKGVAVTCAMIVLFDPLGGFVALLAGMGVVLVTKYLPWGALVIPLTFIVVEAIKGISAEALVVLVLLFLMMFLRHGAPALRAVRGTEPKVDVVAEIRKRRSRSMR